MQAAKPVHHLYVCVFIRCCGTGLRAAVRRWRWMRRPVIGEGSVFHQQVELCHDFGTVSLGMMVCVLLSGCLCTAEPCLCRRRGGVAAWDGRSAALLRVRKAC